MSSTPVNNTWDSPTDGGTCQERLSAAHDFIGMNKRLFVVTFDFSIRHSGGDGADPFSAQEEEKPKQEVPQVSSPQPASPTGSEVLDTQKDCRVYCAFGSKKETSLLLLQQLERKKDW